MIITAITHPLPRSAPPVRSPAQVAGAGLGPGPRGAAAAAEGPARVEREIFPAGTDSRFLRALGVQVVSLWGGPQRGSAASGGWRFPRGIVVALRGVVVPHDDEVLPLPES